MSIDPSIPPSLDPQGRRANKIAELSQQARGFATRALSPSTSAFIPYTPTWTATGTSPNVLYTITGRYQHIDKLVECHIVLTITGVGGGSFGTGVYLFSLPVAAQGVSLMGTSVSSDVSTGNVYIGVPFLNSSTTVLVFPTTNPVTSAYTATVPVTWAVGDIIRVDLSYEAG